jgi:hypothetical protein
MQPTSILSIAMNNIKSVSLPNNTPFNTSFKTLAGSASIDLANGQIKISNLPILGNTQTPVYLYGPVKETFINLFGNTTYEYVIEVNPSTKATTIYKINADGTLTNATSTYDISKLPGTYKIIDTPFITPATTQQLSPTPTTTPSPTYVAVNMVDKLAEKGIKVLGAYLNNPMPNALQYSSPGTFLSQIDYHGDTNIYSPLIRMGKKWKNSQI